MSKKVFSQDEVYEFLRSHQDRFRIHILERIPPSLRSVITAEDVLQDVQLAARAQLSVFKGTTEKSMDTWLTRITTGCTLDAIKRELRIKRGGGAHATNASVFERSSVPDFFGVTLSPQRTPSSLAAADEAVFHALASLKWLNARAGVIVRMRYLNQMSEKRIAECLKCRLDVVRGVIWRSRMSMATIMGGPSKFYSDA